MTYDECVAHRYQFESGMVEYPSRAQWFCIYCDKATNMLRELTSHKVNGLNECLKIEAIGEVGHGGGHTTYRISGIQGPIDHHPIPTIDIRFQNGALNEVGANGISQEALLAIVEDRLSGFQSGPYACRENAVALTKIQEAMMWLQKRTTDRMKRGVEGTHEK